MSSSPADSKTVHLIVADVWKDKDDEPRQVHLLLMNDDADGLVRTGAEDPRQFRL